MAIGAVLFLSVVTGVFGTSSADFATVIGLIGGLCALSVLLYRPLLPQSTCDA